MTDRLPGVATFNGATVVRQFGHGSQHLAMIDHEEVRRPEFAVYRNVETLCGVTLRSEVGGVIVMRHATYICPRCRYVTDQHGVARL